MATQTLALPALPMAIESRETMPSFILNSEGERHLVRLYEISSRIEGLMKSGRKSFTLEVVADVQA